MKNPFVFAGFCLLVVIGCSRADKPTAQGPKRSEAQSNIAHSSSQPAASPSSIAPLPPPSANNFVLGKSNGSANSLNTSSEANPGSTSLVMPPHVPPPPKDPRGGPVTAPSPWVPSGQPASSAPATDTSSNSGMPQNPLRTSSGANPSGSTAGGLPRGRITGLSPNPFRTSSPSDSDRGDSTAVSNRSVFSAPTPSSPGPSPDDRLFVPSVPQTSANAQFDATGPRDKSVEGNTGAYVPSSPTQETAPALAHKAKTAHQHDDKLASDPRGSESELVKVFYATDRKVITAAEKAMDNREFWGYSLGGILLLALIASSIAISRGQPPHSIGVGLTVVVCFLALVYAALTRISERMVVIAKTKVQKVEYGSERGELQLGVCEVSIPKIHQVGKLEAPSIFRMEFSEDKERHIILERTVQKSEADFYHHVQEKVNRSPRKDLFVFIHGYNETFEDAALRTAQMAHDLGFEGAPVFYSWPSKGDLLGYSFDENNVAWTVPHLKQFLLNLAKNSDAKAVNLIAHSMGNRALTAALKELSLEARSEKVLYNEVILAAPDIDADTFKNDIAPYITKSANRVTLYASSRDKALEASQLVHGYPRAGESGARLMVIPGIETVDVSQIDTTLLGHTYISGNEPILHDLNALLHDSRKAAMRPWLKLIRLAETNYWVFTREAATASLATPPK